MKRPKERARRGEIGLILLASGAWAIRWGRRLARRAGLPVRESTQTRDRREAQQILERRQLEVYRSLGDLDRANAIARVMAPVPLDVLVSDFLRAHAAGELPGRKPAESTVELTVYLYLGKRGGLLPFATGSGRTSSHQLDEVLVARWLEQESRRVSNDSVRMKRIAACQLARYAHGRGLLREETLRAIEGLRSPPSAKGRARVDGVPSQLDVHRLLDAMRPVRKGAAPFHKLAELQLRLGLRRSEVVALAEDWLDEDAGRVHVRVSDRFDTKSHASRTIDGVDPATMALAREVLALKARFTITAGGYKEAWKRACVRLERAGTPWTYRNKSHALRAVYATQSRLAGIPLTVVRDRLGHASERTTERHYIGRTAEAVAGPFDAVATHTAAPPLPNNVIPFRRVV